MTKSELRKMLKPLIKECLSEMILEEGLLSNVVSEVMKGQQKSTINESKPKTTNSMFSGTKIQEKPTLDKVRRQLADTIGKGAYGEIFEGLQPAPSPDSFGEDSGDPGMDLSLLKNVPGLKGFK